MGSLFRSEQMQLCRLFLQTEAAFNGVSKLGELGVAQFKDLNADMNAFKRKFVNEVRRCDEMERRLRVLYKEMTKHGLTAVEASHEPETPQPREMVDLEAKFEKLENEVREVNGNRDTLMTNYRQLIDLKSVLEITERFFKPGEQNANVLDVLTSDEGTSAAAPPGIDVLAHAIGLNFVTGVIIRKRIPGFERVLWRVSRGNTFVRHVPIAQQDADAEPKSVFIIFFQGNRLKTSILKICDASQATLYTYPEQEGERADMLKSVVARLEDLDKVLDEMRKHRERILLTVAENVMRWMVKVAKMKAVFTTMNLFRPTHDSLIAECWISIFDLDRCQQALRSASEMSGSAVPPVVEKVPTTEAPPTYNRVNKFTRAFQGIVDAYGVAAYREVNPAPFTIISFPFLFAIMFGDSGHGLLVTLFAIALVVNERKLMAKRSDNEIFNTFFGGRYIILLMGLFSVYTGLIYNDTFSKSMNIFGSAWRANFATPADNGSIPGWLVDNKYVQLNPDTNQTAHVMLIKHEPYPFGVDPVWMVSINKILFSNSFKMKVSIVLGVSQMLFGVILGIFNHTYFRRPINIICEFIPQLLFLTCIFGYLCFMIIYKWIAFEGVGESAHCAPSLLIVLINMFMLKYPTEPCSAVAFYGAQQGVQTFLVLVALVCVPWMLIPKPVVIYLQRKKQQRPSSYHNEAYSDTEPANGHAIDGHEGIQLTNSKQPEAVHDVEAHDVEAHAGGAPAAAHGEHEEDMSDVVVHQCIHTIEFCLGCVSHTASYLRLWALSLAHGQLSEVLWNMVFKMALSMNGIAGAFIMVPLFAAWAVLTVGVLLVMEGLSAFLHALRLHWVEFQSKFYVGSGYLFQPFAFAAIVRERLDEATRTKPE